MVRVAAKVGPDLLSAERYVRKKTIKDRFPQTHRDEWLDSDPYQEVAYVDRWRADLGSVGLA